MEAACPRATLLNYSNPMSMNMQTVFRTSSVRAVGLCHSVQGTFNELMRYLNEEPGTVAFTCAGINHMAFYLSMTKDGHDLYPRLFQAMSDPAIYGSNKVRFELMRRLGRFVTESSEHNAEYSPWFINHGAGRITDFVIPLDEYLSRCDGSIDEFARLTTFARSDNPVKEVCRSHEYGATIMHSMVTGTPSVIYGNLVNGGTISNLPRSAIVEAPTLVDRSGLHHVQIGELPTELVGYMQPHVIQHELFIQAAMQGRRDHVYQACMYDPLTAATLPPDRIVEMCDAMIDAHGELLPPLAQRSLVPSSGMTFEPVTAQALRAARQQEVNRYEGEYLKTWLVSPVYPSPTPNEVSFDDPSPVDPAKPDTSGWQPASAGNRGLVDFIGLFQQQDWCHAYAYAELDSIHSREATLALGSDDGILVWLNGVEIFRTSTTARPYRPREDTLTVHLREGRNRILVKVLQRTGGWGFGVAVSKPTH